MVTWTLQGDMDLTLIFKIDNMELLQTISNDINANPYEFLFWVLAIYVLIFSDANSGKTINK